MLPVLEPDAKDADFVVNDSLAICKFLAEQNPELHLWPRDRKLRALARAAAAEMHSGYTGKIPVSEAATKEIRRIVELWSNARATTKKRLQELGEKDEGFSFGAFSIADAFFWSVLRDPLSEVEHYENLFKGNPDIEYSQFSEDWTFDAPNS
ncbi:hypothetical protein F4818DRAFT_439649 [Hypoxylon cercidicola]|nr:hypothetical protein F4818DRAFT_439649 [Hypoxylon cercidicola]